MDREAVIGMASRAQPLPEQVSRSAEVRPCQERWFRAPTLVRNDAPTIMGEMEERLERDLLALSREVLDSIEEEFRRNGCAIVSWDGEPLRTVPEHIVVLNPVFVGELSPEVRAALRAPTTAEFREVLREQLPEHLIRSPHVGRRMRLHPALHPNLANVVFVDDEDGALRELPAERKIILTRLFMAKLMAPKIILAPYMRSGRALRCPEVMLGTLEGGHPLLPIREAARRLMIFGSATAVGGWELSPHYAISDAAWASSPVVQGLRELGTYLGERNLLSDPVNIRDLVREARLAEMIINLLNYSRQAEGAFWAVDHAMRYSDGRMPWPSVGSLTLVTVSGRYGARKTDLAPDDIVGVLPRPQGTVEVVAVGGRDPKGPSVEAEEFTLPLREIEPVRVVETPRGLKLTSDGGRKVPAVRAGVHLHRGFQVRDSDRVLVIPTDIREYPHVGCGVDLMHAMSSYAMREAVARWEKSGRKAEAALFYVPNHGVNIFLFWSADEHGIIPADPFQHFRRLVDEEAIVFEPDVPQV
jgi:hypothetical protein